MPARLKGFLLNLSCDIIIGTCPGLGSAELCSGRNTGHQQQTGRRLIDSGSYISANVAANMNEQPLQRGFQEAAKLATVVDENSRFAAMEQVGDQMYEDVLIHGIDPVTAVKSFQTAVKELPDNQLDLLAEEKAWKVRQAFRL
ncbi:MAG: hypothetical protein ACK2T4_11715 [Candidatus Promineifilaceae bacterium]|jgi:hypothetical protein